MSKTVKKTDAILKHFKEIFKILNFHDCQVFIEEDDKSYYIEPEFRGSFNFNKNYRVKLVFEDLMSELGAVMQDDWPDKQAFNLYLDKSITLKEINKIFNDYKNLIISNKALNKFKL